MRGLIVEDELNILEMIRKTIPWRELGIDEVLSAENGRDGIEIIRMREPEIVITDIEMPIMDGIRMTEKLAEEEYRPEMIFLTAHAEFAYAQVAIRYGAVDYLLKPFMPEKLIAVLTKAIVRCREKQDLDRKEIKNQESARLIQKAFFTELLNHSFPGDTEGIRQEAERRGIRFDARESSRLIAFRIDTEQALEDYGRHELLFILENIATEVMFGLENTERGMYTAQIRDHGFTAYYVLPEQEFSEELMRQKVDRFADALKLYLDLAVSCVVSGTVTAEEFADTRDRLDELLLRNVSASSSLSYLTEDSGAVGSTQEMISQETVVRLIREHKKGEMVMYLKRFLEKNSGHLNSEWMQVITSGLTQAFYGYMYENRLDTQELMQDNMVRQIQKNAASGAVYMIKYANYMYDYVTAKIDESRSEGSAIDLAKKYIEAHFMEEIGRQEIANEVLLAPNYLSKLFHRETGRTIREYINICRVEDAKKRIETTRDSMTEIAMAVGFDNISYFSTIFRKYAGMTPVEYRSMVGGK